jgi:adenylyltransferase/sulfurtransferase
VTPPGPAELSPEETRRYLRQTILPELGLAGQQRLKAARVLCIGAGGLGSPAALYLASAGIGTIGLVDEDRVDLTNLHRQVLHGTSNLGELKLGSARQRLLEQNPHVFVALHHCRFDSANAAEVVAGYDVVIDGSDNFPTRYASNDACVAAGKPNIYGSVFRFEGQVSLFAPHLGGPCYRCHFPKQPPPEVAPSCAQAGVLGVLPGIIGLLQATEAIKLIAGMGEPLIGRLLHFDALSMRFREFHLRRNPGCAACGRTPQQEPLPAPVPAISVQELDACRKRGERVVLLDVREPAEFAIAAIEGSQLIPLRELDARIDELDRETTTVVLCHSGMRSAYAVGELQQRGFGKVRNLTGGIDAWSREIDPSVPRY